MSWLSVVIGRFGAISKALLAANRARDKFVAFAKSDSYTALYELVEELMDDDTRTGAQKRDLVLKSLARDVVVFGEFFIRAAIDLILDDLGYDK